ncbi:hypothetical protein LEMA_P096070.1 [Plenodomus lingam JN3]|uniref:EthD domain-containing protein n=1 Tax=Leptosphaeria maculans (strain JN3 / isolate v23.1.3 / race Av1-4-5-6-7-8) TaxID=985895 RepID=E5A3I5_LEPMJ|nr:hypothetical protein LEMA_P096070.1 [Plenodomus lingam JN3]CBX98198.1 hypothetical protein LEMA_P096070.1 [Plenodomus lingam JN3]
MCSKATTTPEPGCKPKSPSLPCPNHYTHPYHFDELRLGGGSNQQPYFRALVFFNKKPEITDDFFHEHWKSVHADLTMQVQDSGVFLTRYVQFHQEDQHKIALEPLLEASIGSMQIAPYDGCAEFHAESAEHFVSFMKGVYASAHLVEKTGCGTRFVDLVKGYHVMAGYDNLIFGPKIRGESGSDGIMKGDKRLNVSERIAKRVKVEPRRKRKRVEFDADRTGNGADGEGV